MAEDTEEWVEVASSGDDEEAEIIAGLLESEGFPVVIEGPSSSFPEDLGAMGMSRVLVPPDRAEEARVLIAESERDAERNLADEGRNRPRIKTRIPPRNEHPSPGLPARALRDLLGARPGGDGRRLSGARPRDRPARGDQDDPPRSGARGDRGRDRGPVPQGSQARRPAAASQHRHRLRRRPRQGRLFHRDGVRRRQAAHALPRRRGAASGRQGRRSSARRPRLWPTRTSGTSSTATSSPGTS